MQRQPLRLLRCSLLYILQDRTSRILITEFTPSNSDTYYGEMALTGGGSLFFVRLTATIQLLLECPSLRIDMRVEYGNNPRLALCFGLLE
jgi:hypothetical protein